MKKLLAVAVFAAMSFAAQSQAATLIINSEGKLTGATDVFASGKFYSVTFVDGSCASLFSGCDSDSDFPVLGADAVFAAGALFSQVFTGVYDTDPSLTNGCSDPTICTIYVPYEKPTGPVVRNFTAVNFSGTEGIFTTLTPLVVTFDTSSDSTLTYAIIRQTGAVPEPGTWTMMLLGFGVIGASMRRRRRAVALPQIAQLPL